MLVRVRIRKAKSPNVISPWRPCRTFSTAVGHGEIPLRPHELFSVFVKCIHHWSVLRAVRRSNATKFIDFLPIFQNFNPIEFFRANKRFYDVERRFRSISDKNDFVPIATNIESIVVYFRRIWHRSNLSKVKEKWRIWIFPSSVGTSVRNWPQATF